MSKKILTNWHPVIRWILLPFAVVISYFLSFIVVGFAFSISGGSDWVILKEIGDWLHTVIAHLTSSACMIYIVIILAPSHTKAICNIVRALTISLFSIGFYIVYEQRLYEDTDLIKYGIGVVASIIGLFLNQIDDDTSEY